MFVYRVDWVILNMGFNEVWKLVCFLEKKSVYSKFGGFGELCINFFVVYLNFFCFELRESIVKYFYSFY